MLAGPQPSFRAALAVVALALPPAASAAGKHHRLAATPETVQWGWLDPKEPPKLRIASGDTVSIETWMHAKDQFQPGISMEKILELRKSNPGGAFHSLTGPIYVEGAEPGDALEIRILKIVPKRHAGNYNLPGKDFPAIGALAPEFPEGHVEFFDVDPTARTVQFRPGIEIPLRPFPGTLAVGLDPDDPAPRKREERAPPATGGAPQGAQQTVEVKDDKLAPVNTVRPWKNGSNMDLNELTAGSTLFVPVFLKGGLIWTGDSHCAQGNGEVNLTALECSYEEIELQPIVRKDLKLTWPRVETKTHYILLGFDEDLNKAMANAVRETVDFLVAKSGLTRYEAYALTSMAADCRVTQVVDVRKGVHCMVPKSLFTGTAKKN